MVVRSQSLEKGILISKAIIGGVALHGIKTSEAKSTHLISKMDLQQKASQINITQKMQRDEYLQTNQATKIGNIA